MTNYQILSVENGKEFLLDDGQSAAKARNAFQAATRVPFFKLRIIVDGREIGLNELERRVETESILSQ